MVATYPELNEGFFLLGKADMELVKCGAVCGCLSPK